MIWITFVYLFRHLYFYCFIWNGAHPFFLFVYFWCHKTSSPSFCVHQCVEFCILQLHRSVPPFSLFQLLYLSFLVKHDISPPRLRWHLESHAIKIHPALGVTLFLQQTLCVKDSVTRTQSSFKYCLYHVFAPAAICQVDQQLICWRESSVRLFVRDLSKSDHLKM